jgi:hypothetical protein
MFFGWARGQGRAVLRLVLLVCSEQKNWRHSLLVRRGLSPMPEYAFYFPYAPRGKAL